MYTYNSIHVVLQVAKSFDSRNLNYTRSVPPTNLYTHIVQRVFSCFIESKLPHSNSQAPSSKLHAFAILSQANGIYTRRRSSEIVSALSRAHFEIPFCFLSLSLSRSLSLSLSLSLSFSRIRWISVEFRLIRFAHTHSILVYIQNIESLGFTLN